MLVYTKAMASAATSKMETETGHDQIQVEIDLHDTFDNKVSQLIVFSKSTTAYCIQKNASQIISLVKRRRV
jgi:hypothetical protein